MLRLAYYSWLLNPPVPTIAVHADIVIVIDSSQAVSQPFFDPVSVAIRDFFCLTIVSTLLNECHSFCPTLSGNSEIVYNYPEHMYIYYSCVTQLIRHDFNPPMNSATVLTSGKFQ